MSHPEDQPIRFQELPEFAGYTSISPEKQMRLPLLKRFIAQMSSLNSQFVPLREVSFIETKEPLFLREHDSDENYPPAERYPYLRIATMFDWPPQNPSRVQSLTWGVMRQSTARALQMVLATHVTPLRAHYGHDAIELVTGTSGEGFLLNPQFGIQAGIEAVIESTDFEINPRAPLQIAVRKVENSQGVPYIVFEARLDKTTFEEKFQEAQAALSRGEPVQEKVERMRKTGRQLLIPSPKA